MVISGEQEKHGRCGITELPDCIMESIISFLPLKDAVNTILASPHQWKTLSHSILTRRKLELNYFNVFRSRTWEQNRMEDWARQHRDFPRRVSKYLQQYQGNKVDSFKLQFYSPIDEESDISLDEWIRFAFTKGVEELHLDLPAPCHDPPSIHVGSTSNLRHLSLKRCTLRHATADFGQLITLSLRQVVFNECLMPNLFSVCVLLESLTLDTCQIQRGLIVGGDRLTHLKVIHCDEGTPLEIRALNLTSLEYVTYYKNSRFITFSIKAPQLTRVFFFDIAGSVALVTRAVMQFAMCPVLETLHLHMPAGLPRMSSIPTYGNLKQLSLDIEVYRSRMQDIVDVDFVLDLIKAAPLLEELVMKLLHGGDWSKTKQRETRNHYGFTSDHLRMVKMQGCKGSWYDIDLAIGILEISPKLEMLVIDELQRFYLGDGMFNSPPHYLGQPSYSEQLMGLRGVMEEKLKTVKTDAKIIFQ